VMSIREAARLEAMWIIRGGLALTFVAVLVVWLSGSWWVSAVAMAVAGFGVGILYPPAAAITLAAAPGAPAAASARLVLAAGLAILVAPLLLGVAADVSDIGVAWLLVPGVCVGVIRLSVVVDRARRVSGIG
jgi:MFS family permease